MDLTCSSKIDGCSLRRIVELPFQISDNKKCIGIPGSSEFSDEILLVDRKSDLNARTQQARM